MDLRTKLLLGELLMVRSPIVGVLAFAIPLMVFLWVVGLDVGFNIWVNLLVALFIAFLTFMAMNEILAISNHLKTVKILKLNEPSRTTLEALIIDPNLTGLTSNQTRAIKNHLKRHM
ncbi:hypothetical protein NPN16_22405 [Vibrio parahaemolyticus]|uniref:hypothetical protein n=1 Tax=Vibrio parahaemolyticus TaxID=670 RepID=UPI0021127B0E|nr:hypothetical protein [Vibrio parahaemolyticus]MCQ4503056.1 hypothetical protein [Vibrio parahaemolyticus]MCQ6458179.1 hypothetical protein [Vibrio parahaemolyticus]MCQ6463161.1 hypothetical protein [Vibrio parahaemolyticus]MCQ6468008.1 hypothetical protein [Vibrio parahaemolyticus]MCQ6473084.1 hypothetical protein [Vibrio parahaemolyticus]